MPALVESGRQSGEKARIVNTSSALAARAPKTPSGIDWDTVKDNPKRLAAMKKIEGIPCYGQSKLVSFGLRLQGAVTSSLAPRLLRFRPTSP